jgi:hypothetical protein
MGAFIAGIVCTEAFRLRLNGTDAAGLITVWTTWINDDVQRQNDRGTGYSEYNDQTRSLTVVPTK